MYMRVTVTANAPFSLMDNLGLEAQDIGRSYPFISISFNAGDVKTFDLSQGQWDRMRAVLDKLSLAQFPIIVNNVATGAFESVLFYTAESIPGNRARILQVIGAVSLGSATNALVLNGENLIRGNAAHGSMGIGTAKISFVSNRKGPEGNNITVNIAAASGSGSVTTVMTSNAFGNTIAINVVPASGGPGANAIAAQINANALANFFVQATGSGTTTVVPASVKLIDGEGSGIAYNYFVNASAERLTIQSRIPGNNGNAISIKILAATGAGAVAVSTNDITVTPAAAGDTVTAVRTLINGDAAASALVVAAGTGTHSTGVIAQTWLHGGSGETPVMKFGSEVCMITSYSDTQIVTNVDGTALSGYSATDQGVINLNVGFSTLSAQQVLSA